MNRKPGQARQVMYKSSKTLLLALFKPHGPTLALAFLSSLISVAASLAVPVLLGFSLDLLIGEPVSIFSSLTEVFLFLAISILLAVIFQWLQGYLAAKVSYSIVKDLRASLYEKIDLLSVTTLEEHRLGDLTSLLVNDVDLLGDGLLQGSQQLISGVATIVGTMVCMLLLSVPIGLLVICLTPLSILVTWFIAHFSFKSFQQERHKQAAFATQVEEMFANEALMTIFNHAQVEEEKAEKINQELYTVGERSQFAGSLTNPGTRFVNNIVYALVALLGCMTVLSPGSTLTIGVIQSFLVYASQYSKPFYEITGVLTQLQAAFAGAARIAKFLSLPDMEPDSHSETLVAPIKGALTCSHVDFAYTDQKPVLQDVSFSVKPAKHIALVGETGCGKTTLINLIMRFIDPNSGCISLDSCDTQDIKRDTLRSHIGMVLQESWIFEGTVLENIAFAKEGATFEEVVAAAKKTRAHDFIEQMEEGYNTRIGGSTHALSEGQKQLIAITRAVLKDAPVLILDEATSSIDTRTELLVQRALEDLMKGRTSITVAHRLSTIQNSDTILVMDKGHIAEKGTHQELLLQQGLYAELYASQFAGKER